MKCIDAEIKNDIDAFFIMFKFECNEMLNQYGSRSNTEALDIGFRTTLLLILVFCFAWLIKGLCPCIDMLLYDNYYVGMLIKDKTQIGFSFLFYPLRRPSTISPDPILNVILQENKTLESILWHWTRLISLI